MATGDQIEKLFDSYTKERHFDTETACALVQAHAVFHTGRTLAATLEQVADAILGIDSRLADIETALEAIRRGEG